MTSRALMLTTHRGTETPSDFLDLVSVPQCLGVTYAVVYERSSRIG
jgi:hypothetical protein